MAGIKDYSTTNLNNTSLNGISVAEGMLPSNLNNAIRALMVNTRSWYNDSQWTEYGDGDGAYTAAYASATSFTIAGVDVTPIYHEGRRIKLTATTPGTIYGTISSSTFSTDTTINVTWDSGSLSNEAISNVYIGALSKTNNSLPTGVIATATLADGSVTTIKIADSAVTTAKINDAAVTNAKLGADSVNGSKIADDSINSEHYVDGSIDTAHIADSQITTAKIADSNVTNSKLATDSVTTAKITNLNVTSGKIADASITNSKIASDAVDGTKIADDSINSEHYADGSIDTQHIADSQITTSKIADSNVTTSKIADSNITTSKINNDAVTADKIADAVIVTNAEASGHTPNDTTFFTTSASDGRYFRQDSSETISSGDTWSDSDSFIATTAAIDDRIIDLVDEVGGFVAIANEDSFPTTNPDINDGTGTIVSIADAGGMTYNTGTGVSTDAQTTAGTTVTINSIPASIGSPIPNEYGMLVETTSTLNTYTFHRLVPIATEVTTVASVSSDITTVAGQISPTNNISTVAGISSDVQSLADIEDGTVATNAISNVGNNISSVVTTASNISDVNNFANVYRISSSAPTTSLDTGDLYFDTTVNELKVYGASGWQSAGSSVNGTSQRYNYTATSGQTTFTGADNNGNTLTYDAGYIDVYLNGVKLLNGTDVTVTSGSSVVLASGATTGDIVDIVAYGTFSVASLNADNLDSGTVPSARISGAYTGITNLTMSGDLTVDTNTLKVDSTNNRVGILTTSPAKTLQVLKSDDYALRVGASDYYWDLGSIGGSSPKLNAVGTSTSAIFEINGSEKMRIDSSGNVFIGKTSTSSAVAGIFMQPNGGVDATRSGVRVLTLNRLTSDGDIIELQKDNTKVGSIGSLSSALVLESNSNTGFIKAGGSIQYNWSIYDFSAQSDNVRDLGKSSKRWKDLYLGNSIDLNKSTNQAQVNIRSSVTPDGTKRGGQINLSLGSGSNSGSGNTSTQVGDTLGQIIFNGQGTDYGFQGGSIEVKQTTPNGQTNRTDAGCDMIFGVIGAGNTGYAERLRIKSTGGITFNGETSVNNALDDYEEGTWTPTTNIGYANIYSAIYVKIGRLVFAHMNVVTNAGPGDVAQATSVSGLPFSAKSSADQVSNNNIIVGLNQDVYSQISGTSFSQRDRSDNVIVTRGEYGNKTHRCTIVYYTDD